MRRKIVAAVLALLTELSMARFAVAQNAGKLEFDVASVKQNKTNAQPNSNVPLGIGDIYTPTGGYFSASGVPLIAYLVFAYKITNSQVQFLLPQLPGWATSDRFDIQARAEGNPTKDQLRVMMQGVLEDRFKLKIRRETREAPVFALLLAKTGILGPQMQKHPDAASCSSDARQVEGGSAQTAVDVSTLHVACGGMTFLPPSAPGRLRIGARNLTMRFIASSNNLMNNLDRPVLDRTGLSGTYDFLLEYTPERRGPAAQESEPQLDSGPTFQQAMREQLGLKFEAQKGPIEVLVVDHVERPSEN